MVPRHALAAACAALAAALAVAAPAAAQAPLAGEGENMELIGNHPVAPGVTEMELAGPHAYVVHGDGMTIVDVSNPTAPTTAGTWECAAGWGDVELDPQATFAIVANAYGGSCADDGSSLAIVDISDKSKPRTISSMDLSPTAHTVTLDGRTMYVSTGVWALNPDTTPTMEIYDISDLRQPKKLSEVAFDGPVTPHDGYVDHRPDGKSLFYSGSGHAHHVIDVTDPKSPQMVQTVATPDIEYAHQDEPTFDRKMIVSSSESLTGLFGEVCGSLVGAISFYEAAADGTWALAGARKMGFWNIGPSARNGACSSHVYWQAPNEYRLTMGMYTAGVTILDFSDPLNVKRLGWFKPESDASTWGAKPHNGHVFASGSRGLDVYRYTGENGTRWPATAGPAEVQRAARQGTPLPPAAGPPPGSKPPAGDDRRLGRFSARVKVRRVPGRRGRSVRLAFVVADATGRRVEQVPLRRRAGRRTTLRATGVAVAGTYRWAVRAGRRTLARGTTRVSAREGLRLARDRRAEIVVR